MATIESNDMHGRQILTVGALLEALKDVDPGLHVVLADGDWYRNVETTIVPGGDGMDEGFTAVTFFPGSPLDTRQF